MTLLPALLWVLLAQHHLPLSRLDGSAISAVITSISERLRLKESTLTLQTALDCLSLATSLPEFQAVVDDAWLARAVSLVSALTEG